MATGAPMDFTQALIGFATVAAVMMGIGLIPERYRPKWIPRMLESVLIPDNRLTLVKQVIELRKQVLALQEQLVHSEKAPNPADQFDDLDISVVVENAIKRKVANGIDDLPLESLLELKREVEQEKEIVKARSDLIFAADQEMESATKIKRYMLNLFILFNLGLMLNFALYNLALQKELPAITQQVILGLYVSMAAFIVYVYRACNARVLILLAVQEDAKRYFDALHYLSSRPAGTPTTKSDIAVLKLLLINRSERERATNHPYELVIKGVRNSAILLKGGKVETTGELPRSKPQEKKPAG